MTFMGVSFDLVFGLILAALRDRLSENGKRAKGVLSVKKQEQIIGKYFLCYDFCQQGVFL